MDVAPRRSTQPRWSELGTAPRPVGVVPSSAPRRAPRHRPPRRIPDCAVGAAFWWTAAATMRRLLHHTLRSLRHRRRRRARACFWVALLSAPPEVDRVGVAVTAWRRACGAVHRCARGRRPTRSTPVYGCGAAPSFALVSQPRLRCCDCVPNGIDGHLTQTALRRSLGQVDTKGMKSRQQGRLSNSVATRMRSLAVL